MAKGKYKLRSENRVNEEITLLIANLRQDLRDNAKEIVSLKKQLAVALQDSEIAKNSKLVLEELNRTKNESASYEKLARKLHSNVVEVLEAVYNPVNEEFMPMLPLKIMELGIEFDVHYRKEPTSRTAKRNLKTPAALRKLFNAIHEAEKVGA